MSTSRRQFLRGAVSAAVAASLPGGDGVALFSAKHPSFYGATPVPALLPMFGDADTGIFSTSGDKLELVAGGGVRMASALARSLNETREQMMANVLTRAFDPSSLEEIEVDIKRGGSTDEPESNV